MILDHFSNKPDELISEKRYPEFCSCKPSQWKELPNGYSELIDWGICKYCQACYKTDEKIKNDLFKFLWQNLEKHSLRWWD